MKNKVAYVFKVMAVVNFVCGGIASLNIFLKREYGLDWIVYPSRCFLCGHVRLCYWRGAPASFGY